MLPRFAFVLITVAAAGCASTAGNARPADAPLVRDQEASSGTSAAESPAIRIFMSRRGADRWTLRADVAGASRVELAGDFSDWDPIPLARVRAGDWAVDVSVRSGVHQLAMRVDGGPWRVPAGLASVTDEFGGVSGVLIVPASGDASGERGSPRGEGGE